MPCSEWEEWHSIISFETGLANDSRKTKESEDTVGDNDNKDS